MFLVLYVICVTSLNRKYVNTHVVSFSSNYENYTRNGVEVESNFYTCTPSACEMLLRLLFSFNKKQYKQMHTNVRYTHTRHTHNLL